MIVYFWSWVNDVENDEDLFETAYKAIEVSRYLERDGSVENSPERFEWLLKRLDDKRFKQEVRMSRSCFFNLVELLRNHPIFLASKRPQRPIEHQLLVALRRFGFFGNGASVGIIARNFAISGNFLYYIFFIITI